MRITVLVFLLLHFALTPFAQEREPAFKMNSRLGRGINMGNAFEAPSEAEWGNPWKPEYFEIISELGFSHVRIPIRWEPANRSLATTPYTISPIFLERVKEVIDTALKNRLHVIINMHHHDALIADPQGQKERFLSQWEQISEYFRSYPDSLLFEILNEPNGNLTTGLWNQFLLDALGQIRKNNPTRTVLIGTAEWGGIGGLNSLKLPDDNNIIATVHYYNPFEFTHQGTDWSSSNMDIWLGTKWNDTEAERHSIVNDFKAVKTFSELNKVPVYVGEFGSYNKADMESREKWTTYLARYLDLEGYAWAYWEFSAGFGIYNPATKELSMPLVNALLHNTIPPPTQIEAQPIYTSNFETSYDGWNLYLQSTAAGSMSKADNKLSVKIIREGSESWHVQLVKLGIPLEKGKMYRMTFKASSTTNKPVSAYIGRNHEPWSAYSSYLSFITSTSEETFNLTFTMNEADDLDARIVFDLGMSAETVTISDIKLEVLSIVTSGIEKKPSNDNFLFYPNPVKHTLNIYNPENFANLEIINISGVKIMSINLHKGVNRIHVGNFAKGVYILKWDAGHATQTVKIMKE